MSTKSTICFTYLTEKDIENLHRIDCLKPSPIYVLESPTEFFPYGQILRKYKSSHVAIALVMRHKDLPPIAIQPLEFGDIQMRGNVATGLVLTEYFMLKDVSASYPTPIVNIIEKIKIHNKINNN